MNETKNDETLSLPESWKKASLLATVGAGALLLSLVISFAVGDRKVFFHSYLTNFIFVFSFSLGALFFVLIQFLTRAGWSVTVRRLAEIMASLIPWLAVLFIPIIVLLYTDSTDLYEWNATSDKLEGLVALKTDYLNRGFFSLRALIYLGSLSLMAIFLFRTSRRQDESGDVKLTLMLQKWSGPMVMLFALVVSGAAFDWIMSVDADWYSTIFGVYWFAASMMSFFAFMIATFYLLQKNGKLKENVTVEHYHDMGKYLFGFVLFWSYIAFSQLLLYWYANIPEEAVWFHKRILNGWKYISYGLIPFHFAIPLLGVMSRHVRRCPTTAPFRGLVFWAGWLLLAHWVDCTFLIMPNVPNGEALKFVNLLTHLLCGIGMTAIYLALFVVRASDVPLLAKRDPRLHEAMSYTNPIL